MRILQSVVSDREPFRIARSRVAALFGMALCGIVEAAMADKLPGLTGVCVEDEEMIPADGAGGDFVGNSVAIDGDVVVVGAPLHDEVGKDSGAAYLFRVITGAVEEIAKLTVAEARFLGNSVAISGDTVVVGVGRESDTLGSAYVLERDAGGPDNWGHVATLTASAGTAGDGFGWSVWIDGDTVVVGAPWDDAAGTDTGALYVFERDQDGPGNWGEVVKIIASDAVDDQRVGNSVAISGDTILAGTLCSDFFGPCVESAYIFERDLGGPDNWGEAIKLVPSDSEPEEADRFGIIVSLDGDTAVVGADTDLCDPLVPGPRCGSAFVFERDAGGLDNWGEAFKLTGSDSAANDGFGISVAVGGDLLVAGAWRDSSGSAYLFRRDPEEGNLWEEIGKIDGFYDLGAPFHFGVDVAVDRGRVVIGAQGPFGEMTEVGAAYWLRFLQSIFADGFESGDTSGWGE